MNWPWKKQKKAPAEAYDRDALEPVIRSSICTGEKTAGFIDNKTGKYRDVMLIKSDADLTEFRKLYGVDEVKTIY